MATLTDELGNVLTDELGNPLTDDQAIIPPTLTVRYVAFAMSLILFIIFLP